MMLSMPNVRQRCPLFIREHRRLGKNPKKFNAVPRLRKQRNVDMTIGDLRLFVEERMSQSSGTRR